MDASMDLDEIIPKRTVKTSMWDCKEGVDVLGGIQGKFTKPVAKLFEYPCIGIAL